MATTSSRKQPTAPDFRQLSRIFMAEMAHLKSLRSLNIIAALLHTATIFLFFAINIHSYLPVVAFKATTERGDIVFSVTELIRVDLFVLVVLYLCVAAIFHLLVGTVFFKRYIDYIKQHRNPLRWFEYSISCSLMLVALSLSSGIGYIGTLFMIFFASFTMIISGLVFENVNRKANGVIWSPFVLGTILGTLPWVLIFGNLYAFSGSSTLLSSVSLIYGFVFLLFLLFPINTLLSAKRIGPWKSYITTEMGYMTLSYFSKTILATVLYFNLTVVY